MILIPIFYAEGIIHMANLELHNLGPIKYCNIDINDFTIFTGPQASGKSTIAKAIFFFRTVKQDFYNQLTAKAEEDDYQSDLERDLKKRLRRKFLQIFGTSWAMPSDMKANYTYSRWSTVSVFLSPDKKGEQRNFVDFSFGDRIHEFIIKYKNYNTIVWTPELLQQLKKEIQDLFADPFEIVYIPAGRSMITLLTDQLTEMLMDESIHRLDYCMRSYIRTIVSARGKIGDGLTELMRTTLHTTQKKVDRNILDLLMMHIEKILHGKYAYMQGEERLVLENNHYVKINYASSGQQESVWVLNLLYLYLLERKKIFLIVEEPEAHLYPESQKYIAESLGIFASAGNQIIVTTHSPYILGEFNNQLFAGDLYSKADKKNKNKLNTIINIKECLDPLDTKAYYLINGKLNEARDDILIKNELIDGASTSINDEMDKLLEISWDLEEK